MGDTTAGPGSKSRHACVPNPEFVRPESEQKTRRPFPATVVAAVMSPGLVIVLLLAYRNHLANKRIKQLEIEIMRAKGYRCLVCDEDGMWKCAACGGEPPIIDKEYIRMSDGWIRRKVNSVTQSTCHCFPGIAENKVEV